MEISAHQGNFISTKINRNVERKKIKHEEDESEEQGYKKYKTHE